MLDYLKLNSSNNFEMLYFIPCIYYELKIKISILLGLDYPIFLHTDS